MQCSLELQGGPYTAEVLCWFLNKGDCEFITCSKNRNSLGWGVCFLRIVECLPGGHWVFSSPENQTIQIMPSGRRASLVGLILFSCLISEDMSLMHGCYTQVSLIPLFHRVPVHHLVSVFHMVSHSRRDNQSISSGWQLDNISILPKRTLWNAEKHFSQ